MHKIPVLTTEIKKEAIKLYALGYKPIRYTVFPIIGKINYETILLRYGEITPAILYDSIGKRFFMKHERDVGRYLYNALVTLCRNDTIECLTILCKQRNENI